MGTTALRFIAVAGLIGSMMLLAAISASAYPEKPITLVVPAAAGSGPDAIARPLMQKLSAVLGKQCLVVNRPGASATIGFDSVAKAKADGYTLLYAVSGPIALNPLGLKKLPYDPKKDLVPITQIQQRPLILIISATLPSQNLAEFIQYVKARPGSLSFATWGVASSGHLAGLYLNKAAGIDLTHVPYNGSYLNDVATGRVAAALADPSSIRPFLDSGRIRALAAAGRNRLQALPDVPTFNELGFPALEQFGGYHSIFAPAGTPEPILEVLNKELMKIVQSSEMMTYINERGGHPAGTTLPEARKLMEEDDRRWQMSLDAVGGLPPLE